jgi:hypothetical protein
MRRLLFAVTLLAGCIVRDPPPPDDGGWGPPPPPPPPPDPCGGGCFGGEVCARDGECLPPSEVRAVHLEWTVQGAQADATNCSPFPDLFVDFIDDSGDRFGFSPVPCVQGRFSVDKLPTRFTMTELGVYESHTGTTLPFDETGTAKFDLP